MRKLRIPFFWLVFGQMRNPLHALLCLALCLPVSLTAQPGSLDPAFNPGQSGDGVFHCLAAQSDGRILIGGAFTNYQGTTCNGLTRINTDGSIDPTFTSILSSVSEVYTLAVDDTDRILIGGNFNGIDGTPINCIARLLPDGQLDPSFDPGIGANYNVNRVIPLPDGAILVGGDFATMNGQPRMGLARLLESGALDLTMDPGAGFYASSDPNYPYVKDIAVDANGDYLVAGSFDNYDGASVGCLVKLSPSGNLIGDFAPPFAQSYAYRINIASDERISVAGYFQFLSGIPETGVAGLLSDGTLDPAFAMGPLPYNVNALERDPQDRLLVAGSFDQYQGYPRSGIARTAADGNLDLGFQVGSGIEGGVPYANAILVDASGGILVAGNFDSYDGILRTDIVRLQGGSGPITCFDAQDIGAFQPGVDLPVEGDGTDGDRWTRFETSGCAQLVIRQCAASGITYFAPGLFTTCPIDTDLFVFFEDTLINSCGGADYVIAQLPAGQYWLGFNIDSNYAFEIVSEPCPPVDCLGVIGGPALPDTPCDDLDPETTQDAWTTECDCVGVTIYDCEGVAFGPALPGAPCDDGLLYTNDDAYTADCICAGFDCAGVQGGSALPGSSCDDGLNWTYFDAWTVGCVCVGTPQTGLSDQSVSVALFGLAPNPNAGEGIMLRLNTPIQQIHGEIIDQVGRCVYHFDTSMGGTGDLWIQHGPLASGLYTLCIVSDDIDATLRFVMQ